MLEDFSLLSVLTLARYALLFAGACAVAVWATRQPDQHTSLIAKLTGRRAGLPATGRCALESSARPNQPTE